MRAKENYIGKYILFENYILKNRSLCTYFEKKTSVDSEYWENGNILVTVISLLC